MISERRCGISKGVVYFFIFSVNYGTSCYPNGFNRISYSKNNNRTYIKYVLQIHFSVILHFLEMYQGSLVLVRTSISHCVPSWINSVIGMVALTEAIALSWLGGYGRGFTDYFLVREQCHNRKYPESHLENGYWIHTMILYRYVQSWWDWEGIL